MKKKPNNNDSFDLNNYRSSSASNKRKSKVTVKKTTSQKIIKGLLITFMCLVICFCIFVGGVVIYVSGIDDSTGVDLEQLKNDSTTTVYTMNDEGGWDEYQRLPGDVNRIWVSYEEIPDNLKNAFIAVEDKRFLQHGGVDWRRTFSAFANYFLHFYSSNQGGSTITQQLVKNITGDDAQTPQRKVQEIMRARRLEMDYSKETILECYMNMVSMANNISGVEVAANYYFNKSVGELTLAECATLAGITKYPEKYKPDKYPENALERRNLVLSLMYEQNLISESEYKQAKNEQLVVVADHANLNQVAINNYFVDALIEEVIDDLAVLYNCSDADASYRFYNNGYKIYCTMNPEIQETVDKVYSNEKTYGLKNKGVTLQGAITVMDYSGHIVGIAGGIGEKSTNRGFNRATMAVRQPGSTMKPIAAYALSVEKNNITYSTVVEDKYKKFGDWSPKNWYGGYWGYITSNYALERSVNTIPVFLVDKLSVSTSYDFLTKSLKISNLNEKDKNLSSLGMGGTSGGLTTTDSAAAYAIFGNLGKYYEPTTYYYVTDSVGTVILENNDVGTQVISEDTATVMNYMLRNVVYGAEGTGGGAGGYVPRMKIYAKTGTSNDTRDLWFVGGTPYYVASCWCGYDDNYTINSASIAQRMWGAVMKPVHSDLKAKSFKDSKYVSKRYYCAESGLLATTECTDKLVGYYKNSYLPYCSHHGGTLLPPISGSSVTASGESGIVKGNVTGLVDPKEDENSSEDTSDGSQSSSPSSSN